MRDFDAWGLAMLLRHIDEFQAFAANMCALENRDSQLTDDVKERALGIIIAAQHHAQAAHLESTSDRVWDNGPFSMAVKVGMTWQQLQNELTVVRQCIEADLEKRLFAFVEPKKADLLTEMDRTWERVFTSIPDAKDDVEDAIIAYMVELNTAAVFHLMRVAEHGLRVLAKKMRPRVTLTHKGRTVPIEYADWEKVITAIKNTVASVRLRPVGPKRQAELEKYSDAADHCVFMKDIWRNTVSHARKPYKGSEASSALERVRAFMQFVATEFV